MDRRLGGAGLFLVFLLFVSVLGSVLPAEAAHKPHYKGSVDHLAPGGWEAHMVWLRNPHFNYGGKVEWEFRVQGEGTVDVLFVDWAGFQAFRAGRSVEPLLPAQEGQSEGVEGLSGLTPDLPYFLILRNPGDASVAVRWELFAEIDWRRWQGQEPGPTLNLEPVASSPLLAQGESWETVLTEPGFYYYECFPHADMTALLEVVPGTDPDGHRILEVRDYGFHPEVLTVAQGTTLRWTNVDGVAHSVQLSALPDGLPEATDGNGPAGGLSYVLPGAAAAAAAAAATIWILRRRRTDE